MLDALCYHYARDRNLGNLYHIKFEQQQELMTFSQVGKITLQLIQALSWVGRCNNIKLYGDYIQI